jgi:hypothetical protein
MGRNLHYAVRPEGGVPELAGLRHGRRKRRLILALLAALPLVSHQLVLAADTSPGPENGAEASCTEIKNALHALGDSEHDESLALSLASNGGNSSAIVEARLSVLLDRTQDLRAALQHARQSPVARDPQVEQCMQMGYRALVVSEKLSSDVETVLFGGADSVANAPELQSSPAPAASPPARQP